MPENKKQIQTKDKTLLMTVGFPRSGKTTWARKKGYPIVNPDAVRLALHGHAYIALGEKMVWAIAHYMINALFLAGHDRVILDACNNTRKRRDDWKSLGWLREFVVFDTPAEDCLLRVNNAERNAEGLKEAITRMAENHECIKGHEEFVPGELAASAVGREHPERGF